MREQSLLDDLDKATLEGNRALAESLGEQVTRVQSDRLNAIRRERKAASLSVWGSR